jgi:hypothetical protein
MVSLYLMCSKQTFVFDVLRFQYIAHNIWPLLPLPPEMWGLEVCASCLAPIKVFINWPRFASITPSLGSWVLVAGYNLACPLYFSVDKYEWGYLSASSHLSSFSFCRYILIQTSLLPRPQGTKERTQERCSKHLMEWNHRGFTIFQTQVPQLQW